jgi:hypothetical protein
MTVRGNPIRAALALLFLAGIGYACRTDQPMGVSSGDVSADVVPAADPVIVAAGDIVCGSATPAGEPCKDAETAALIGGVNPEAVLLLGDNQYETGSYADFLAYYDHTWGAYKAITHPAPGNHEYQSGSPAGYFDYFNGIGVQNGAAGDRSKGYYSYDIGSWHLIAINSNCTPAGGCGAGSPQELWLRADLAAHPNSCTLAYWHHPRFSSGYEHGNNTSVQPFWDVLYAFNADVIMGGHDHDYERFAPQTPGGIADATNGIRQFVVGTGGRSLYNLGTRKANSAVFYNSTSGVLKLTLSETGYAWQYIPTSGSFTDTGTGVCH